MPSLSHSSFIEFPTKVNSRIPKTDVSCNLAPTIMTSHVRHNSTVRTQMHVSLEDISTSRKKSDIVPSMAYTQYNVMQRSGQARALSCATWPNVHLVTWCQIKRSIFKCMFSTAKKNYTLTPCTYKLPKRTAKSYTLTHVTYTLPEQNKL